MRGIKKQDWIIVGIVAIVLVALFVYGAQAYRKSHRPHVWDIYVINLDKDKERWESVREDTRHIAGMVYRFPAVYGKELTQAQMVAEGVGFAMTRSGDGHKEDENLRNLGTAGCWLSHKRLLKQLAEQPVADHAGHLIVEDDVAFPSDFLDVTDAWHKVYQSIPTDWDMVYFGITAPNGPMIAPGVRRLETKVGGGGNWGTHAYLVRHGAIRTKLLPWLEHMVDAVDEQYNMKFSEWNVYAVEPSIIPPKPSMSALSSLKEINSGGDKAAKYD